MAEDGKPPRKFKVGDKVWLDADRVQVHQASRKLGPRQLGPYEITEKLGDRDYRLKLPAALKIHDVFHDNRLAPWGGSKVNGELSPPPAPVEIDHEEEFEVEDIVDSRLFRRQLQYLVRWKGYSAGDNSWEPAANLTNAKATINKFHRKFPNAVKKISASIFASLPWQPLINHTTQAPPTYSWEEGRLFCTDPSRTLDSSGGGNVAVSTNAHQFFIISRCPERPGRGLVYRPRLSARR